MPDPTLLIALAATGWLAALVLFVLWRRAAPSALRCSFLERSIGGHEARAEQDAVELRRLSGEESRLAEGVRGLEARLEEARIQRERLAAEARAERDALSAKLDAAAAELSDLKVAKAAVERDLAARTARHDEEVALLKELRDDMGDRFKALADATLKDHGARFGELNRERMEALVKPMREQVGAFQRELREAHTGAMQDRERLHAEIGALSKRSADVSREAVALTNALKGEKQKQGAWGEMILERVLEDSGLRRGHEYDTQVSVRSEEGGRRRPDAVVRLPGGKAVVVDSKVSLIAYEAAVNSDMPEDRERNLRLHVRAVKAHIDELAGRDYDRMVDGSVDYVLMFMPVEGALAAALEVEGDLTAYAIAKRVGIATPTTLMMALRTIQHVWAVERRESNAEEIADRAGRLFDKMAGVVEALQGAGEHLEKARVEHDRAMGRLHTGSGNVLRQFEMLRHLGARTERSMADVVPEMAADAGEAGFLPSGGEGVRPSKDRGRLPAAP